MTREELIAALEKAAGPSMVLSRDIARHVGWHRVEPRFHKGGGWISPADFLGADADGRPRLDSLHGTDIHREPLHYTASIDAALTLVPEEWTAWEVRSLCNRTQFFAEVSRLDGPTDLEEIVVGYSPHPAIALCIAALKARVAP